MNIGIDGQTFRGRATGIYYYLWNLLLCLDQIDHGHMVSLVFYGPKVLEKSEVLDKFSGELRRTGIKHIWDGWPLYTLSKNNGSSRDQNNLLSATIDRRVIRLWTILHKKYPSIGFPVGSILGSGKSRLKGVDVFHHTNGLVLPVHDCANVMTFYDLIPYRFPGRYPKALRWMKESCDRIHEMDIVLAISQHTKSDIIETLKIPEDKVRVTPLAAHAQYRPIDDTEEIRSVTKRYGIGDRPYIISVGTVEYRRNMN